MTITTDHTDTDEEVTPEAAAAIAGIRAFADHLEQQPDLANYFAWMSNNRFLLYTSDPDEFRTLARALGGDREKDAADDYMTVRRHFGPIEVQVYTARDKVCTRRQVGIETVEVVDPNAPKVTIERPVFEWDCAPVLNDDVVVEGEF